LPAERDLAQRFGVSRTAVREAVKTLREKGLVEAYSGRGTFVTNGTSQAMRQSLDLMIRINQQEGSANLAELRLVLEPEIAGLAAPRIEEQLLATMREAVAVMDRNLHDPDAYVEADLDFHLALAEAAGNPLILSLLDSIVGLLREQRSRIFNVDGGPERGQFHHKRILAAIEKRDPDSAREAMRAHLQAGAGGFVVLEQEKVALPASPQVNKRRVKGINGMAKLGFIGLGVMGGNMVARLLEKGHTVTGYNRTRSKAQWLIDKGMKFADSPKAVAEASDVTFTMVTNAAALTAVTEGPDGLLAGIARASFTST
jgi:DNA-binding FadR family transcriptional regulator